MQINSKEFSADSLVLGTALWGWKIAKKEAFAILDAYVSLGGQVIDTAENYPINKVSQDMGLASKWIGEWLSINPSSDVSIWYKMGAKDNLGGDNLDLSLSHLSESYDLARTLMQDKIKILGVHWDNRSNDHFSSIIETLDFLKEKAESGLDIALSGVKYPELYHELWPEYAARWLIQVKDNALTSAARSHYANVFPHARYYAYGINMGGVKSSLAPTPGSSLALRGISPQDIVMTIENFLEKETDIIPSLNTLNDFALIRCFLIPEIYGVVLGPSSVKQLNQSFLFWRKLHQGVSENALAKLSEVL